TARRGDREARDDRRKPWYQREEQTADPEHDCSKDELPAAEVCHGPSRQRSDRRAAEVDHEDRAERTGGETKRRRRQIEIHGREGGDEGEQHAEADRVGCDQRRGGGKPPASPPAGRQI